MKKLSRLFSRPSLVAFISVLGLALVATAGSLTPPGSPSSTMHTLAELYDGIVSGFDSTGISANQNGSLIEHLKYIEENMSTGTVGSDSLDFDEFVDSMNLDADTAIANNGFALTFENASVSNELELTTTTTDPSLKINGSSTGPRTGISADISGSGLFSSTTGVDILVQDVPGTSNGSYVIGYHSQGLSWAPDTQEITGIDAESGYVGTGTAAVVTGGTFAANGILGGSDITTARGVHIFGNTSGHIQDNYGVIIDGYETLITGSITNNYGIRIETAFSNIENSYGLYVDPTMGSSGSFNIFSAGDNSANRFQGHMAIGNEAFIGDLFGGIPGQTLMSLHEEFTDLSTFGITAGTAHTYDLNPTGTATDIIFGQDVFVRTDDTNTEDFTGGIVAGRYYPLHLGSGTVSQMDGLQVQPQTDDGTVTQMRGILVSNNTTGTGDIGDAYAIYVDGPLGVSGITNNYGLFLEDQSGSTGDSFNIYSAGAGSQNYFAGFVGIASDSPTEQLSVVGNERLDGRLYAGNGQSDLGIDFSGFGDIPVLVMHSGNQGFGAGVGSVYTIADSGSAGDVGYGGLFVAYSGTANPQDISALMGLNVSATHQGTGTVAAEAGGLFFGSNFGTGTVTQLDGINAQIDNSGGGTVINGSGVRIASPFASTFDNLYGLYIDPQTAGDTSFNIYSAGAGTLNFFEGFVGVATDSPQETLSVQGTTRLDGHVAIGNAGGIDRSILNDMLGLGFTHSAVVSVNERLTASAGDFTNGMENDLEVGLAADDTLTYYTGFTNNAYTPYGNTAAVGSLAGAYNSANAYGDGDVTNLTGAYNLGGNWGDGTTQFVYGSFNNACNCVEAGNITNAYGTYSAVQSSATGVITNAYDLYAEAQVSGGAITNNYGLYVADQGDPSVTNGYNIYSAGTSSRNIFEGSASISQNFELSGTVSSHLIPTVTNTYDLGSPTLQWRNLYVQNFSTGSSMSGNFDPAIDNTYDLGDPNYRWRSLYLGPGSLHISSTTGTAGAGSNYTDGVLSFSGASLSFGTSAVGTGSVGSLALQTGGINRLTLSTDGTASISNSATFRNGSVILNPTVMGATYPNTGFIYISGYNDDIGGAFGGNVFMDGGYSYNGGRGGDVNITGGSTDGVGGVSGYLKIGAGNASGGADPGLVLINDGTNAGTDVLGGFLQVDTVSSFNQNVGICSGGQICTTTLGTDVFPERHHLDLYGTASMSGNFDPTTTNTYALGSPTLRWSNIYANNASISENLEVFGIASVSQLFVGGSAITGGVGSDSLDFDEFVDNMTLDANTTVANNGFALTFGNASVSGNFELSGFVASNLTPRTTDTFDLGTTTLRWRDLYLASGSLHIGTSGDEAVLDYNVNDDYLSFKPDGSTTRMAILDAGSVGIGTTSPGAKLDVLNGNIRVSSQGGSAGIEFYPAVAGTPTLAGTITGVGGSTNLAITPVGNVGIGTTIPGAKLDVSGTASISGNFGINTNKFYVNATSGNIGIGTTTPATKFQVVGFASISSGLEVSGTASISKILVNLSGTQTTSAVCHPTNGQTTAQELVDCDPAAADYMELYPMDSSVQEGDIVMPDGSRTVTSTDHDQVPVLVKATDRSQALGIVSIAAQAGDFNSVGHNLPASSHPLPVALNGRVKVAINAENGPIAVGDPVTLSSVPGVGAKATTAGFVIGTALESGTSGQILVFVRPTYWAPDIQAATAGQPSVLDEHGLFDRFIAYIADIVLQVRGLTADEVHTDKICVGGTCVTEEQFQAVFGSSTSQPTPTPSETPSPSDTPVATPEATPETTPEPSATPTPTPDATPEVTPTP